MDSSVDGPDPWEAVVLQIPACLLPPPLLRRHGVRVSLSTMCSLGTPGLDGCRQCCLQRQLALFFRDD